MAQRKIRYAVAGGGWITQAAALPAFQHADGCELAALFSSDSVKQKVLGEKYGIPTYPMEDYAKVLSRGGVDAVYIALPNHLHKDYTVQAAEAGVHVLCEKPMAVTEEDCERMIAVCAEKNVKLMIAYRLHFDEMTLEAAHEAQTGALGDLRYFMSAFSQQVPEGNIRLRRETGGGTLYDLGVYCINAARNLFREEPVEAFAVTARNGESRFNEIEEMASATLRFPGDRLAAFTCSFGAASADTYRIVGTKGDLIANPCYSFEESLQYQLTVEGKKDERKFAASDQFAAELIYFADCIRTDIEPEPDGWEGLADVRVVRALYKSVDTGSPVKLEPFVRNRRPDTGQEIHKRAVKAPELVNATEPAA